MSEQCRCGHARSSHDVDGACLAHHHHGQPGERRCDCRAFTPTSSRSGEPTLCRCGHQKERQEAERLAALLDGKRVANGAARLGVQEAEDVQVALESAVSAHDLACSCHPGAAAGSTGGEGPEPLSGESSREGEPLDGWKADVAVQMTRFGEALDAYGDAVGELERALGSEDPAIVGKALARAQDATHALTKRHRLIVQEWADFRAADRQGIAEIRQDARDDFFSAISAVAEKMDEAANGPNKPLHRRSLHAVAVPMADILRAKALCEANDAE